MYSRYPYNRWGQIGILDDGQAGPCMGGGVVVVGFLNAVLY